MFPVQRKEEPEPQLRGEKSIFIQLVHNML